jgi:hypothetical protein
MVNSSLFRRLGTAALVVGVLALLPAAPAGADGDDGASIAASNEEGLLQELLDWLLDAVSGVSDSEPNEGDTGAGFDPSG